MKKLTLFIFALFILVSACQPDNEIKPSNTFENELEVLYELNHSGFNFATISFDKNLTIQDKFDIGLNKNQFVNDILRGLNDQFFMAGESVINEIASQYGEIKLSHRFPENQSIVKVDLSQFNIYSDDQLKLVQPFVDRLLNTEDMEIAKSNAVSFQHTVINSPLSDDEKMELLTLSSGVLGFTEFVENGGIENIQNALVVHLNKNGIPNNRFRNCSVSMRHVWLGAVVGGGVGAIGGAKVGCAGGLVGGPLGAAGGCVGGAVMGGASGFISGALMTAGAELLGSCFR